MVVTGPEEPDDFNSGSLGADFPGVRNTTSGVVSGVAQFGVVQGDIHLHAALRPVPAVPLQLPAAPGLLVGRTAELDMMDRALAAAAGGEGPVSVDRPARRPFGDATVMVSAMCGAGGVGKTWLALAWAHRHLDRFPDGQLFVDLRGFSPEGEPMASGVAVRGFLDALGVRLHRTRLQATTHPSHADVRLAPATIRAQALWLRPTPTGWWNVGLAGHATGAVGGGDGVGHARSVHSAHERP
ncbi:hypothetical protein FHS29_007093 [Saccharothrix tamanrassetensis]|uniref:Uncharacterized protein n=1 Tax=Saccharothrix tamanrassetensis TaxID=1051531 RepID=A0A841CT50_9PSEU|nr:hypothetical protein [Saccharothrix tamanrassetensis]